MITLATATAYVGQMTAKQVATVVGKLAADRLWALKAAHEALGKVPRPRPRRRLASWLKRTETLTDVLLVPDRPGEEVVVKVDDALSASGRWRSVPSDERLRRAEMVAVSVYDAVLSAHSPGWSARIGTARVMGALEGQADVLRQIGAEVGGVRADISAGVAAGNRERLDVRLRQLPPPTHEALLRAWDDDPTGTWSLVTGLTDPAAKPEDVVAEWSIDLPDWMGRAGPALLIAGAGLAIAYGGLAIARGLLLSAARAGAAGRQGLIARAAMTFEPGQEAEALAVLAEAGEAASSDSPFVRGVHAVLSRDWARTGECLAAWEPADRQGWAHRWAVAELAIFLPSSSVTPDMLGRSIDLARTVLAHHWINEVALTLAQRLIMRSVLGGGNRPYADLEGGPELAVRVRDDRRAWRGDSAAATSSRVRGSPSRQRLACSHPVGDGHRQRHHRGSLGCSRPQTRRHCPGGTGRRGGHPSSAWGSRNSRTPNPGDARGAHRRRPGAPLARRSGCGRGGARPDQRLGWISHDGSHRSSRAGGVRHDSPRGGRTSDGDS